MKTRAEVEDLKQQWLADGCWDLEATEGYEEYREELALFSRFTQADRAIEAEQIRREAMHAAGLATVVVNIVDHGKLFDYIKSLEARIAALEAK